MDFTAKIGSRIKELRIKKWLTHEGDVWKATFMNQTENSKRNISIETLEKIVRIGYDTDIKTFL